MADVPDYIVDPVARFARNFFLLVGTVSALVSYLSFKSQESGWFAALVALGAFWIAMKIVVRRPLRGGIY